MQYLMQLKHYITHCVSHQNTCNYSLSANDYKNYTDNYDSGKKLTLYSYYYLFYLQYWLESINETLKQMFILAIAKKLFLIVTVSVPHMANAMPIHMVKTALYPFIIQLDEETI